MSLPVPRADHEPQETAVSFAIAAKGEVDFAFRDRDEGSSGRFCDTTLSARCRLTAQTARRDPNPARLYGEDDLG